jgi:hypothetical protein
MSVESDRPASYFASFRNFELRTWETSGRYSWTVKNSDTGEQLANGDAKDLPSAMVAAAEAAGADWGSVKWRGRDDETGELLKDEHESPAHQSEVESS